jgi:hypothetical protein
MRNLAILAAAILLTAGCGKPENKFVGTWDGTMELPPEAVEMMKGLAESIAKSSGKSLTEADRKAMEEGMASMKDMKLILDLKDDGTCTMTSNHPGQGEATNGTWQLSEDQKSITINMQQGSGAAVGQVSRAIAMVLSADGKSMSFEDNQMGMKTKLTFNKR